MTGRTIAHFEILEKLGEGGMGAVYKARDTHLDRLVALKVLRQDRVADPERRRRFITEAKAASALNHANIITIHDIDRADGIDFMAMELIRGRTLDSLVSKKGLSLGDTLKHAIQIAGAIEAAHAAHIVHRDLKPANVMVTDQGVVKVLDFGLAKLVEASPLDPADATASIHAAAPETESGTILGTVAYMSPEQAEGKEVDARSDIFSFGVMLYEMVSGRRAFQRESKLSTLSAILQQEPPPLAQVAEGAPHELERIVVRCLRKDPERRFQLMKEVRIALEELKEESESGRLAQTDRPVQARRKSPALAWGIAAGLLLLAGAGAWVWTRDRGSAPEYELRQLTADAGLTTTPAISRDGKMVAYASDRASDGNLDLWVHPLTAGAQAIRLTRNEADDMMPDFSPDGGQIVFHSRRDGGGVYVIPALGGEERLLARGGQYPRFSPDGKWVAYSVGDFLASGSAFVIPAGGGAARRVASNLNWAVQPNWSATGKSLLVFGSASEAAPRDWWLTPVDGGAAVETGVRPYLQFGGGEWSWSGSSLIVSSESRGLWRIDLDRETG
ncbi:MAG: serine/threonine-protein kinase, partial [Candidatus Solibacter usitatus]|nr:serine/threonine-protein kinase [Candidatus Solibacter usitatus]